MADIPTRRVSNDVPERAKRGRPTQGQVAAIDRNILVAARRLFLENGYMATSMEAVGAASGVSKRTLYARYAEKSALFHAIVHERLAEWSKVAPFDPIDGLEPAPELLTRYGRNFLAGLRIPEVNAFYRLMLAEAPRFPELSRELYVNGHDNAVRHLAKGLEKSMISAGHKIAHGDAVARTFTSALLGWFESESMMRSVGDSECEAYVERLTAIFVRGLEGW